MLAPDCAVVPASATVMVMAVDSAQLRDIVTVPGDICGLDYTSLREDYRRMPAEFTPHSLWQFEHERLAPPAPALVLPLAEAVVVDLAASVDLVVEREGTCTALVAWVEHEFTVGSGDAGRRPAPGKQGIKILRDAPRVAAGAILRVSSRFTATSGDVDIELDIL